MRINNILGFGFLLLAGCSAAIHQGPAWDAAPENAQVWPAAGAPARIKLLRVVTPQSVSASEKIPRFMDWLTGQRTTALPLLTPYSVVADGEGRIWIADPQASLVHCFDLRRQTLNYWYSFDNINLLAPVGLGIDLARGQLYVSDSGLKTVFIVSLDGKLRGELHPASGFGRPTGVAVDGQGLVYVADAVRSRIEVFKPSGDYIRSIGAELDESSKLSVPIALALSKAGHLLVNDSMKFRIDVLDPLQGTVLGTIGEIGDVPGTFARPRGIAVDSEDHIYVVDAAFSNVQIFSMTGKLLLYFGTWGDKPGEFSLPAGVFVDQYDRIYVVDSYNHRLQIFQYVKAKDPSIH